MIGLALLPLLVGTTACDIIPESLTDQEIDARVDADVALLRTQYYEPTEPLTLANAIAIALKENLDHKVAEVEKRAAEAEVEVERYGMYPDLSANSNLTRSNTEISSQDDQTERTASFGVAWNFLDFGVSYARTKQSADRVLIAETRRRKAAQDIVRDVQVLFWQVVAAQELLPEVDRVLVDVDRVMSSSRELQLVSAQSEPVATAFRRDLLDASSVLIEIRQQSSSAKLELSRLLNIRPGTELMLTAEGESPYLPIMDRTFGELERLALANRPELQEEDYQDRISQWEAREALLSMIPGITLDTSLQYDSTSFLTNNNWIDVGLQIGSNLIDLVAGPARADAAEERGEAARARRRALSAAVIAQVHLAYHEVRANVGQHLIKTRISVSDRRLGELARARYQIEEGSEFQTVEADARYLISQKAAHDRYAELRRAHSTFLHTLGLDFADLPGEVGGVQQIAAQVQHRFNQWTEATSEHTICASLRPADCGEVLPEEAIIDAAPSDEFNLDPRLTPDIEAAADTDLAGLSRVCGPLSRVGCERTNGGSALAVASNDRLGVREVARPLAKPIRVAAIAPQAGQPLPVQSGFELDLSVLDAWEAQDPFGGPARQATIRVSSVDDLRLPSNGQIQLRLLDDVAPRPLAERPRRLSNRSYPRQTANATCASMPAKRGPNNPRPS
jgi:outer membrane protein TolC